MFAGLLNKGLRGSLLLLIIAFLAAAVACYFAPVAVETENHPNLFFNFLFSGIENRLTVTLLNYLFVGLGLLLVSLIIANQEITDKLNYFPVFLYLIICASSINNVQVSALAAGNVLVLFAAYRVFDTYRKQQVLGQIFEAAFVLSCALFISALTVLSILGFFVALLVLRAFYWREWAVAVVGLLVPFFIYECIAYLVEINRWYQPDAVGFFFSSLRPPSFSEYYLPLCVTLTMMLVAAIMQNLSQGAGASVKKQRSKSILMWFIGFYLVGFFSAGSNSISTLLLFAFPISLLTGDFLIRIKRLKIANTILAVLLLSTLVIFLGRYGIL